MLGFIKKQTNFFKEQKKLNILNKLKNYNFILSQKIFLIVNNLFKPSQNITLYILCNNDRLLLNKLQGVFGFILPIFGNVVKKNENNRDLKNHKISYIFQNKFKYFINPIKKIVYNENNLFFKEKKIKKTDEKKIYNFYSGVKIKHFNFISYYFFNKLIVFNEPQLLVKNFHFVKKSKTSLKPAKLKIFFYFMFIKKLNVFINIKLAKSFCKCQTQTVRGFEYIFKYLNINSIFFKKINIVDYYSLADKTILVIKNLVVNNSKINVLKIFKDVNEHTSCFFKINWYTKIHNNSINFKKNQLFFLRVSKHFNKGRYSRNRQIYRTGVYWCIWLNIVLVYALHYYFYRVVFSFGYMWLPMCLMILSIFGSRLYKYRFYSVNSLITELKEFNKFLFLFINQTIMIIILNCKNYILILNKNYFFLLYKNVSLSIKKFFLFF